MTAPGLHARLGRGGPWGKRLLLWGLSAGLATTAALAGRHGRAVEGTELSRIVPPPGVSVTAYRNVGYRIHLESGEAWVRVEVAPLASSHEFHLPRRSAGGPLERLARGLTTGAGTRYEAVSRILSWVARNLRYELDRSQSQDALSVLSRGSGYCTGVARLSVALLEAVGIEAREVPGYVAGTGVDGVAGGYHRWIEVYYPDRGWVFSDPLVSHHYVAASYLRLSDEEVAASHAGARLLEHHSRLQEVDLYLGVPPRVTARRNSRRREAGAISVVVPGEASGQATLHGVNWRRTRFLARGRSTFLGLDPGSYLLSVELGSGHSLTRRVLLPGRARKLVRLVVEESGQGLEEGSVKRWRSSGR